MHMETTTMKTRSRWTWILVPAIALAAGAASAEDAKVARMWKNKCGSCHGVDGKGATKQGDKMGIADITTAAWQKEFTDDKIKDVINKGISREKNGKQQDMDPLGKELDAEQIDQLIKHLRSLAKK